MTSKNCTIVRLVITSDRSKGATSVNSSDTASWRRCIIAFISGRTFQLLGLSADQAWTEVQRGRRARGNSAKKGRNTGMKDYRYLS